MFDFVCAISMVIGCWPIVQVRFGFMSRWTVVSMATEHVQMTVFCFVRDMCTSMLHGRYVVSHLHQHVVHPVMVALLFCIPSSTIESTWTWVCTQVLPVVWSCFVWHLGQSWTLCVSHCLSVVLLMWHLCLGRHRLRAIGLTVALLLATCFLPGYLSSVICMLPLVYSIYPCTWAHMCFVHPAPHPSALTYTC